MKTKQILIFLASLFFTLLSYPTYMEAQDNPPDSCLKHPFGTLEYPVFNPDSVKIDSCPLSNTYGKMYATKYILQFNKWVYIFKTKPFLMDSLYSWNDIDSNFYEMKSIFRDLEFAFGKYYFKRDPIWLDDSSFIEVPTVQLIFDKYICGEKIINYILSHLPANSFIFFDINQKPVLISVIEPEKPNKEYTITITDNDKLNIKRKVIEVQGINVFIYDLMGNLIAKHIEKNDYETIQIDISNLLNGFYFLIINNRYVYKLMRY